MAGSGAREPDSLGMGRRRWRVPYAIRLAVAAFLAAGVAFGISYALRRLNY
jgi:hypothetical protein